MESSETAASSSPQTQSPQDLMDQDVTCKEMVDSGIRDVVMDDDQGSQDGNVEEINRKQWIQLVKVLVLTAWDQVGLES